MWLEETQVHTCSSALHPNESEEEVGVQQRGRAQHLYLEVCAHVLDHDEDKEEC
jgi:hypothetical protein